MSEDSPASSSRFAGKAAGRATAAAKQIQATAESAAAAANSLVRRRDKPTDNPLLVDAETGLAVELHHEHLRRPAGPVGIDNVLSYSNLVAQDNGGSLPAIPDGFRHPVEAGLPTLPDKGDPMDISRGSQASSSGRWSVLGSERSWTPSAVSDATDRIRNWEAWGRINTFVIVMCVLITVHGTLTSGYINAMVTSIEKRFEIKSRESGMILSSYEIGSLLSVVFVSYFGSQGNIPRWIGIGGIMISVGAALWTMPHWLADYYTDASAARTDGDICPAAFAANASGNHNVSRSCSDTNHRSYIVFPFIAQIIIGAGGSPIFTLGTTYIDNHVPKENSSVFLAVMYVFVAVGPVIGYCLGAAFSNLYVNDGKYPSTYGDNFGPDSPGWIGRWWAGFILCSVLYFCAAIPFFGFPKRLPSSEVPPATQEAQKAAAEYGKSIKKIPFSVFRLLTNSVYMVASLCACMDLAIVSGFTAFLPKYIETQFRMSKALSSVLTGVVAVPGACVGIFLGGWLLKKFKLQLKGVSKLVVSVNIFCLFGLILFFFVGCANTPIKGFKSGETYDLASLADIQGKGLAAPAQPKSPDSIKVDLKVPLEKSTLNLSSLCNRDCSCSNADYVPICGADGATYFSPCIAGCQLDYSTKAYKKAHSNESHGVVSYGECKCVETHTRAGMGPMTATSGVCGRDGHCDTMLYVFLLLLFFLTLVASLSQMPLVMVTLRAVSEEEKAFALGVQVVLFRLVAYIPAPIVFGSLIDTSCLFMKPSACDSSTKTCLLYDVVHFRYRYGIIAMAIKVAAAALSGVLYYCIKRRGEGAEPFSPPITMSEIAHRLGDVDNLHIRTCPPGGMRSWMSDDSLYSRPRSPRKHQKTLSC